MGSRYEAPTMLMYVHAQWDRRDDLRVNIYIYIYNIYAITSGIEQILSHVVPVGYGISIKSNFVCGYTKLRI